MSKVHNKKRNTGLLYEFLVQTISKSLVEGDQKKSAKALRLVKKHFKHGSELYRELRLINSLVKTTVSSEAVAASILQEAKRAARSYDCAELDRQKSLLIRDINHLINDEDFYDQQVNEYRTFATVQTLLNDWRSQHSDLARMATYEDQLVKKLTEQKSQDSDLELVEDSPGTSRLLMKVMMKKLNEKYSGVLNSDQKSLIKAYAFSAANDDSSSIRLKLEETRSSLFESMREYELAHPDNSFINNKLLEAKRQLQAEDLVNIDDDTVTRFMLYTKLSHELRTED